MINKADIQAAIPVLNALKECNWDKAKVADEVLKCSYSFVRDVYDAFYGLHENIALEAINTNRTYAEVIEEKQVEKCTHFNGYCYRRSVSVDLDRFGSSDFSEDLDFIVSDSQPQKDGWHLYDVITFSENPTRWMKLVFLKAKNLTA